MAKVNSVITTNIAHGELFIDVAGVGKLAVNPSSFSDDIQRTAMYHGLKQKICDAAAIPRDLNTGKPATPQQKYDAMRKVLDSLLAGEWGGARGEGGGATGGLLYRALCRLYVDKTPDAIRAWLDGKSKAEQAELRKNSRIAAIIAEIQAEKSSVDTDALLAELG